MSPDSARTFSKTLPLNYVLPTKEFSGWMMPMGALLGCSGSDFTTSPTPTATNGIFSSPFNEGHNPFDASFGEITCDTHQQLSYDISGSQTSLQSPSTQWKPPHSAFPPNSVQLNTDSLYAPQPKRCSGDFVGEMQQGGPIEALETCAISFTQSPSRKRRRTADDPSREAETIPSDRRLLIRRKTMPSTTYVQPDSIPTQTTALSAPKISTPASKTKESIPKRPGLESSGGNSAIDKERHKHVEMKYRKQMKDRFDELLLALPIQVASIDTDGKPGIMFQKKVQRGKVLDLAKDHIALLEREKNKLEWERQILQREVKVYEDVWFGNMGVPGHVFPLN
ncbi:hypothetical protein BDZ45DRAFT_684699 [Acephala macrosclerotiorum]|nr:hypothetical protein BDZ45DRAFT_684699 [Acephala macrosclerotiorum]